MLIIKKNKAFIVSEAYDKSYEWAQALFNQFILNNNEKYFNYLKYFF